MGLLFLPAGPWSELPSLEAYRIPDLQVWITTAEGEFRNLELIVEMREVIFVYTPKTNWSDASYSSPLTLPFQVFPQEKGSTDFKERLLAKYVCKSKSMWHKKWHGDTPLRPHSKEPVVRNIADSQPPVATFLDLPWCSHWGHTSPRMLLLNDWAWQGPSLQSNLCLGFFKVLARTFSKLTVTWHSFYPVLPSLSPFSDLQCCLKAFFAYYCSLPLYPS